MLLKRKPHGGGKHFCKGVALSSFLTAVLTGVSSPSFAAISYESGISGNGSFGDPNEDVIINGSGGADSRGVQVSGGALSLIGQGVTIEVNDTGLNGETGIYLRGSSLNVDSNSLDIKINSNGGTLGAKGLSITNKPTVGLNIAQNINLTIQAIDTSGYGVYTYGTGSETTLTSGTDIFFDIDVKNQTSFKNNIDAVGLSNHGHFINLKATDITMDIDAENVDAVFGIWQNAQSSSSSYTTTSTNLEADVVDINVSSKLSSMVTGPSSVAAVYLQGKSPTGTDEEPSELKLLGNSVYLTSSLENNSQQTAGSYGIYATTAPFLAETYESLVTEDFSAETVKVTASADGNKSSAYGIYSYNSKTEPQTIDVSILNKNGSSYISGSGINGASGYGVYMDNLDTQAENKISLTSLGNNTITGTSGAINMGDKGVIIHVTAQKGTNAVYSEKAQALYITNEASADFSSGLDNYFSGTTAINSNYSNVSLTALRDNFVKGLESNAISASNDSSLILNAAKSNYIEGDVSALQVSSSFAKLVADNNTVIGTNGSGINSASGEINVHARLRNSISGATYAVYAAQSDIDVDADAGVNKIAGKENTVYAYSSTLDIISDNSNNELTSDKFGISSYDSHVALTAKESNILTVDSYGVYALSWDTVSNDANQIIFNGKNNSIIANSGVGVYADSAKGLYSDGSGTLVELNASVDNTIRGGEIYTVDGVDFAKNYAIQSLNGSSVTLEAGNQNSLFGAVYAEGAGATVTLNADTNYVASYAQSKTLGDLDTDDAFKDKSVISALYAEEGANISLTGNSNILRTYAEYDNEDQLERVIWAYNGKVGEEKAKGTSISINGYSYIATDSYEKSPNSLDIAIAAGTAVGLNEDDVNTPINLEDRAKVELTYADSVNEDGSTRHSFISGDILSAYDGLVDIKPKDASNAGINIEGNLLAGNNGIVNVDLGNGGTLTGRADDYGDSGVESLNGGHQNMTFFDPAFSSAIYKGGEVNLTMGEGSRWNVTGQSWITRINTENSSNAIIDLISANTDRNSTAHALTVYELTGNAIFNMSLDADRNVSDMLYIKNADGNYTVNVIDAVSQDDMYAGGLDGLRFATVGTGSNASFRAITYNGGGINNIEYRVGTDAYTGNDENVVYNGDGMTEHKPGDDTVDGFFESDGEPGATTPATQAVSLAAVSPLAEESTTTAAESGLEEVTNFKLIGVESSEISDAGKTVIDMSRANYANAVYMDTLNKRQGEARFVGDTDHGVWVRLRHDNIGKDDSFRSHNTMVEVGFEQRDIVDSGEFHTGFALDYMNGSLDYHTVDGDGDIERYGVWFYTTFLGNDGQYADLVLKYGHLKNDFDFNLSGTGVNVNGDYTNEVASLSAEYGWKFSNSYNYYIEPQAQLQYSYVTGADYTTSYGTKVNLDSIHSLIGRIGFRAGKDFATETPITAYIRGDVLHEFLGDQDIYAYDNTGVMDVTYENDDTWYSAGVGLSVQSSENTYFFIEGEQVFGADNDSTYTVSGGFKHSF